MLSLLSCKTVNNEIIKDTVNKKNMIVITAERILNMSKNHNNMIRKMFGLFKQNNIFNYNTFSNFDYDYNILMNMQDMSLNKCIKAHQNIELLYDIIQKIALLYNNKWYDTNIEKYLNITK